MVTGIMALAGAASANTISYSYSGETGGGVSMGIVTADYTGAAQVGQMIMTSTTVGAQSPILTFCTDVGAMLSVPAYNYTPESLSAATGVAPAWINGGIQKAASLWEADKGSVTTATQGAGLQLAIWEVLYNNVGTGFSSSAFGNSGNGGFQVTSTDSSTIAAEIYAANLIANSTSLPATSDVYWLAPTAPNGTTGGSQGLLVQSATPMSTPPPSATPDAASTLGLLGVAASALVAAKNRLASK